MWLLDDGPKWKIGWCKNFNFVSENSQKSETPEKVFFLNVAWDVANIRYVDRFFNLKKKSKQNKTKKTQIDRGPNGSPTYR